MVREVIIDLMEREWPSNLEDWDDRQRRFECDTERAIDSGQGAYGLYPEPGKYLKAWSLKR